MENLVNFYKGKKVLLTGDTGFKGSWLAIWLLELGAEVFGYSLPPLTKRDNYVVTKLDKKINHLDGDIRDGSKLNNYFLSVNPDITFHLAAQPLVLDSYKDPRYTFETNVLGTVNFFEAVRKTKSVKTAINITSDKCYQNNEWVWGYRENDSIGGNDPYSASKGCSELITASYIKSFFYKGDCNVASVRAGNVIGAGDWSENRIVPDFFRTVLSQKKLIVRNPNFTRPWQHVLEPLSGYMLLGAKLQNDETLSGGWNFGPKDEANHSVRDLVDQMRKLGVKVEIENVSVEPILPESNLLKLDISKAVTQLKWKPLLSFKKAVRLTVEGYESDLQDKDSYENRVDTIQQYLN